MVLRIIHVHILYMYVHSLKHAKFLHPVAIKGRLNFAEAANSHRTIIEWGGNYPLPLSNVDHKTSSIDTLV